MTAGGKNVAPAVLEDRLRAHALVDQCLVVGDGQPFIARPRHHRPRVVPGLGRAARQVRRRSPTSSTTPTCAPRSQAAVDEANKAVSKAESIRKFAILPDDWTEEGGQLTPSLKLKRNVVMREQRDEIAALYPS